MPVLLSALFMLMIFASPIFTLSGTAQAGPFSSTVTIMDKTEISRLTDEKLTDTYMDTLVDIQAMKTFHTTSGFANPRQYEDFRRLLKYRLQLLMEIHNRNLEIPRELEIL